MRVSKQQHDYYDSVLAYGADDTLFFNRVAREMGDEIVNYIANKFEEHSPNKRWVSYTKNPFYSDYCWNDGWFAGVVGFCGKLYPFVKSRDYFQSDNFPKVAYSDSDVVAAMTALTNKNSYRKDIITIILDKFRIISEISVSDFFMKENIPYFVIEYHNNSTTVIALPILKDYNFFKVFDAYRAYQEISMYLGGVLPKQDVGMVSISDKDRLIQHGFDMKTSFRHPVK